MQVAAREEDRPGASLAVQRILFSMMQAITVDPGLQSGAADAAFAARHGAVHFAFSGT